MNDNERSYHQLIKPAKMTNRENQLSATLEILNDWATAHEVEAYVFGSIVSAPDQFDMQQSDIDLVIVAPSAAADAAERLKVQQSLRPLLENLEVDLLRVLKRGNASTSIVSCVFVTRQDLENNVHKSGVVDFFSPQSFRALRGAEPEFVSLATHAGRQNEVLMAVQAARNKYLACSANQTLTPPTHEGGEPAPKNLLRTAAITSSSTRRASKDLNVDHGLGSLIDFLSERTATPMGRTAYDLLLRRCNPSKGYVPILNGDVLLFMWEVLSDVVTASPIIETSFVVDPVKPISSGFLRRVVTALGSIDPKELIALLEPEVVPGSVPAEIVLPIAEAFWRARRPDLLSAYFLELLPTTDELLDTQAAAIARLNSWALWELGHRPEARDLLTRFGHQVVDPNERARWADQAATFARFTEGADWTKAETDYQQSLGLRSPADSLGYAMTLQNLAFLYMEQGELTQSYRFMKRTAEHGSDRIYEGAHVSNLVGTLGMAWLDLIVGHPLRTARAGELLEEAGKRMRHHRGPTPNFLRFTAKALHALRARRRGYSWKISDQLRTHFWPRLIVAQLEVLDGGDSNEVANNILTMFSRPLLVPSRIPFIVGLLNETASDSEQIVSVPGKYEMTWPMSYFAGLGGKSTLGQIQAMELLLSFYEALCRAIAGLEPLSIKSASARVNSLRELSKHLPSPIGTEVLQIASIATEAIPARNRIVHAAGSAADEAMVSAAHALMIEQAAMVRRLKWSTSNPVFAESPTLSFNAESFCRYTEGEIVMTLGDVVIRTTASP